MWHLVRAIAGVLGDVVRLGVLYFHSSFSIRAENLVLRRQLGRVSRISPDRGEVHAGAPTGAGARRSALVDILHESREGHSGVRFLRCGDRHVPDGCAFVVIEHETRRLAHVTLTAHPTADWTLQQLREVVGEEDSYRYLIHDRDRIFARHLDDSIRALGIEVLRSPVASPKANATCQPVIGTIGRGCARAREIGVGRFAS